MSTIDEIKARIDLVDLISETVQLRRSGKNYTGFCPFHPNTRTPAFVVFPETSTWRCFGQCNDGGDIFKFFHLLEEKGMPEEVRRSNAQWIAPTDDERVTLVTCWPYTSNTHRLVIVAKPFWKLETRDWRLDIVE